MEKKNGGGNANHNKREDEAGASHVRFTCAFGGREAAREINRGGEHTHLPRGLGRAAAVRCYDENKRRRFYGRLT